MNETQSKQKKDNKKKKIGDENNDMENRKTIEKITKTKSSFFEIYKIEKLLSKLIR